MFGQAFHYIVHPGQRHPQWTEVCHHPADAVVRHKRRQHVPRVADQEVEADAEIITFLEIQTHMVTVSYI